MVNNEESGGLCHPITRTGACAWIVSTPDDIEWIQGSGLISGDKDPYRSEIRGQLGLATITSGIQLPNEYTPKLTLACDGLSALNQVGKDRGK